MKFGLFLMPLHQPEEDPTLGIEADLRSIELAEELGYDEVWVGEHHTGGWETIASPELFLAAAAQRTSRIKLGTGVITAPFHHPVEIAERVSLLDHLCRGRAMVGLGPGLLPTDIEYFRMTPTIARERLREQVQVLKELLHGDAPVTHHGAYYDLDDIWLQLRPYQSRLPIALTTSGPKSSATALAAEHELIMISGNFFGTPGERLAAQVEALETAAAAKGTRAGRGDWRLATYVYVAESRKQAFDDIRQGAERFVKEYLYAYAPFIRKFFADYEGQPMAEMQVEQIARKARWIIGDPDEVSSMLEELDMVTGGISHLLVIGGGWQPHDRWHASLDLLARHVIPRFRGASRGMNRAFERTLANPMEVTFDRQPTT